MKMKLILPSIACLFVAASSLDCDDAYGRTGHGLDSCPNSHPDKDGALCYPNCQEGYSDDGAALCWEDCDGDIVGALCVERKLKIRSKDMQSRGVGVIPKDCNAGDVNIAGFCHKPCNSGYNYCGFGNCCKDCKSGYEYHSWSNTCFKHVFDFYNAGVTKYANPTGLGYIPTACPSGKENIAGLCYTKCKSGYKSDIYGMFGLIDLTLCWEQCSGDEIDDGKTCRITEQSHFRKSYGRGVGKPLQCADDEEQQDLTCYPKCRDGFVSKGGQGCYANPQTCTEPTKEQTPDPTAKPTPPPTASPTKVVDDVITADAYGFVSDKTCEAYGMEKIDDPIVCKDAASKLAGTHGIRMDYKFIDVVDYKSPGRPQGCSYHRSGNVEQWHHGYDEECNVNGFAGCLCKVVPMKEPSTFVHLGCYKDTGDRAMDHLENGINSIEECRDLCKENGYSLFGLQYPPNGECFCGNDKDEAMQFGEATNCEGGRGGSWSLDIYEMNDGDDEGDLIGTWDWCHDGLNRNGDITIEDDGTVSSSRVDWTGQNWDIDAEEVVFIKFNDLDHVMIWGDDQHESLILVEPQRTPPSVAVKRIGGEVNMEC